MEHPSNCPICCERFTQNNPGRIMHCNKHIFCTACIDKLLDKSFPNLMCPLDNIEKEYTIKSAKDLFPAVEVREEVQKRPQSRVQSKFQILVKSPDGKASFISTTLEESVLDLQKKIRAAFNLENQPVKLNYKGSTLQDGKLLKDVKIKNGDTVHVIMEYLGGSILANFTF